MHRCKPASCRLTRFWLGCMEGLQTESRSLAMERFPSLESQLKRVKDHGRAEALLIASFGEEALRMEQETLA